jgi:hypothetical protein
MDSLSLVRQVAMAEQVYSILVQSILQLLRHFRVIGVESPVFKVAISGPFCIGNNMGMVKTVVFGSRVLQVPVRY